MRILKLACLLASLFLTVHAANEPVYAAPAAAARLASPPPVHASLVGEIVEPMCFFTHGGRGPEHAACAVMCAKGGMNLAFLDERTGRTYPLIAKGHGQNPNDAVIPFAGKRVTVEGTVHTMGPSSVLSIDRIAVAR